VQHNRDGEQKSFNQFGLFSFLLLFFTFQLFAGSFENFKKIQNKTFHEYKDQKDNEFSKYLKEQWQEYQAYITPSLYKKAKPKVIAPLREKKTLHIGPIVKIPLLDQNEPSIKPKPVIKASKKDIVFDFFGTELGFTLDKTIMNAKFYPANQSGVANFFSILASSNYTILLDEIRSYKKALQLNDWALYLLINKLSQQIYHDRNEANIYVWFLFNKLSYNVKLALNESKNTYLLFYSKSRVYSTPRYAFHGQYYYILSNFNKKEIQKIYTYTHAYPDAKKSFDFALRKLPLFAEDIASKQVSFKEHAQKYEITFQYNKEIISFMKTYPQVDYAIYFNVPIESLIYKKILKEIKNYIDGKKMSDALNFVLHFVQKAFVYKRDQEQFGKEKVMFAEETLIYNASDCEDRAVLFAYLVKHIFGIRVVGVKYSDHISTALYIPMQGDSVFINRRKYVLADPTYINANIGQEIPKYRDIQPETFIYVDSL